jgi:hypothetical protein
MALRKKKPRKKRICVISIGESIIQNYKGTREVIHYFVVDRVLYRHVFTAIGLRITRFPFADDADATADTGSFPS